MKCIKCKNIIAENSIRCNICGVKIGRICPECKSYNLITNKTCYSCNNNFLKVCNECNSINAFSAKTCRKCNASFQTAQKDEQEQSSNSEDYSYEENSSNSKNYFNLDSAKERLNNAIKTQEINVISINGENEYAKNLLINTIKKNIEASGMTCLYTKCTPHIQLTPAGYFQNILLNLFNVPNYCSNSSQLKKESMKFIKQDFEDLSTEEIYNLVNILYPENVDNFHNIKDNKQNTIKIIVKIFEALVSKIKVLLIIDNIEYIDNFSYEILNILISNENIRNNMKILFTSLKEEPATSYIQNSNLYSNNYIDIPVAKFTKAQIEQLFISKKDLKIDESIKSRILAIAKNDPTMIEQLLDLLKDLTNYNQEIILKESLQEVIEYRLSLLKDNDNATYILLSAIAILGFKFYPSILNGIFNLDIEEINKHLKQLIKMGYIIGPSNTAYEFKSLKIWNNILETIKLDIDTYKQANQGLLTIIPNYVQSTNATLAFICQNLELTEQAFLSWQKCVQTAAYIGDTGLYIILQKQLLTILDKVNIPNKTRTEQTIYSELGKLLEADNTELAMNYLPKALELLPENNFIERIELLGYLASSSMNIENYYGAMECIDEVLKHTPEQFVVERALIKSRQIKPLLELGNMGSIVNLIENEIIPPIEDCLNNKIKCNTVSQDVIFEYWLKISLNLAKTLALKADNKVFDVLKNIKDICNANNIDNAEFIADYKLTAAFTNTIFGNIQISMQIIDEIKPNTNNISDRLISKMNFINIINKFYFNKDKLSSEDIYNATTFAENTRDNFTKNILKLILGRLIQDRTSVKEASKIYLEQAEYFAQKQNSTGVLLGWYLISKAKLKIEGPQSALDVASKAIDIAQSPNISSNYFIILFNKLIGEIYITLQNYDLAKMHIEKALVIARNFGVKYELAKIYLLYSKLLQDSALGNDLLKEENAINSNEFNKKAAIIANELKILSLISATEKANTILNSFCQMNGIVLK